MGILLEITPAESAASPPARGASGHQKDSLETFILTIDTTIRKRIHRIDFHPAKFPPSHSSGSSFVPPCGAHGHRQLDCSASIFLQSRQPVGPCRDARARVYWGLERSCGLSLERQFVA
jgi:hypothetical protein